ncbi:hypothetical protein D9757_005049 [Collybiopsis confluens]|uniref:Uncharacterized protein n=1 Tax=Collybiopsis confluens TaxID=2823264 RepID=A0A8H5MCK6_9AGAR|nr:hypothetical protein D9757_005049 [Collybiopsis confluens]
MSSNTSNSDASPANDSNNDNSFGLSWEIGVIVAIIAVVIIIIAAVIFQRRRRRRSVSHLVDDLERQQSHHRPRHQTRPSSTSTSSATLKEKEKEKNHKDSNVSDTGDITIAKPSASVSRLSRIAEHPSQNPPKYYWDHR